MCNLRVDALQVSRSYTPITFPGKNEPRVAMQIKDCTVFSKMIMQRCTVYDRSIYFIYLTLVTLHSELQEVSRRLISAVVFRHKDRLKHDLQILM